MPQPRIRSVPQYTRTSGPDAVELGRSIGLIADPWQEGQLSDALAERDDGRWACSEVCEVLGRQNGKGGGIELRIHAGLHLFGEQLIVWSLHRWDTALDMFKRIAGRYTDYDCLRRQVKRINNSHGEEGIELLSGQRLKFSTRSKDGGRGLSGDCVIIDEAYAFTDEHADALIPVLSARTWMTEGGPQIWYTSSPPLAQIDASKEDKVGKSAGMPMYRLRERGLAGGDPTLCYRDWAACDATLDDLSGVDLDDRMLWQRSNPALGIRLSADWIANTERKQMTPIGFARERLCLWPPTPKTLMNAVLDPAAWAGLLDVGSRIDGGMALAVDVTPDRSWGSIAVYGLRADGLGHAELVEHRRGTDWIVARTVELRDRHDPVAIALDLRGPAGSLAVDFAAAGIREPDDPQAPARGDLACPTAAEYAQACGQLVDAIRQSSLRHIGQTQVAAAIAGTRTRPLGDAWAWARSSSRVDISPLVAPTLARWAYVTRADVTRARLLEGSLMA